VDPKTGREKLFHPDDPVWAFVLKEDRAGTMHAMALFRECILLAVEQEGDGEE